MRITTIPQPMEALTLPTSPQLDPLTFNPRQFLISCEHYCRQIVYTPRMGSAHPWPGGPPPLSTLFGIRIARGQSLSRLPLSLSTCPPTVLTRPAWLLLVSFCRFWSVFVGFSPISSLKIPLPETINPSQYQCYAFATPPGAFPAPTQPPLHYRSSPAIPHTASQPSPLTPLP